MRIVQITPGTGNFYCGSCLRDNALVAGLRAVGHDALMVPLYLPFVSDESSIDDKTPIFFGGVNVYLQQKSALFRHTPVWLDQLLDSRTLLGWAAARAGMTSPTDLGELTLSMLNGQEGNQVKELGKLIAWLKEMHRPDVVCLSNVLLVGMARTIRQELGVPVVCTLQGEDSFLDSLPEPYGGRAWRLVAERCVDVQAFIAVSEYHGRLMSERLGIARERLHVVHNGINLDGYAPAVSPPDPPVVGFLARLCPQKGLDTLVDAFIRLRERGRVPGVRLRIAGTATGADESFVASLRGRLADHGLGNEAEFLTNIDADGKRRFLQGLSVLSVPATYGESFGLYLLEAWASGVPVVQPRHGAFPELLAISGGGILCEPRDPGALAAAIEGLLQDPIRARAMGRAAREVVQNRFSVGRMADEVARVLMLSR